MAHVIILAGGKGTRMNSEKPKVLNQVNGIPIIERLLESVTSVCSKPTVIIGHKGGDIIKATGGSYHYLKQDSQLGTGHAVMCAKEDLLREDHKVVLVLPGDHPLVSTETLESLMRLHKDKDATITMATAKVPDFKGDLEVFYHYGRVIREGSSGRVKSIKEFKDATDEEREVKEVNLSYYCFDSNWLWDNISLLENKNASGEYYLTDMVAIANDQEKGVEAYVVKSYVEGMGINTPQQLKIVENYLDNMGLSAKVT